jgi:hypothetical protein
MSSGFRLRTVLVPMNHGKTTNRVFRSITRADHHLRLLRRLICTLKETRNDMISIICMADEKVELAIEARMGNLFLRRTNHKPRDM